MEEKEHQLRQELSDIDSKLQDPNIFSNPSYPKLAKRQKYLEDTVLLIDSSHTIAQRMKQAQQLVDEGGELSELAAEELHDLEDERLTVGQALELALTPRIPMMKRTPS